MSDNKSVNRLFLGIVLFYILGSTGIGYAVPRDTPIYLLLLISQLLVLVPAVCYCWKKRIAITQLIPFKKIKLSTGILVVVVTYLMYPLMVVLNAVTLFFTESGTQAVLQGQTQQGGFLISTLFIAVIPAFVEEFVFRGVLFQTYRKSSLLLGILLSGFLFGIMHMNLNQMVYAFVMGIGMAFLVEATGSILSSMLAHFTLNFTGVVVTQLLQLFESRMGIANETERLQGNFLELGESMVAMMVMVIMVWGAIAIGTTIAAAAIYIYICKSNQRWNLIKQEMQKKCSEKMVTIPLVIAVAIGIGIIIWKL